MENLFHPIQNKNPRVWGLKKNTWLTIAVIVLIDAILVTVCAMLGVYNHELGMVASTPKEVFAYEAPTPTPVLTQKQIIVNEINMVFGKESKKAFKLLSCENHSLNPNAVLDDTQLGGIGEDIGVFQINTIWQGITNKAFLFDPAINIRIAYNIFERDGDSFKMWTCGRRLGI